MIANQQWSLTGESSRHQRTCIRLALCNACQELGSCGAHCWSWRPEGQCSGLWFKGLIMLYMSVIMLQMYALRPAYLGCAIPACCHDRSAYLIAHGHQVCTHGA